MSEQPEPRKVGHQWIDLSVAVAAIVLSLISLVVAINNARTQEKMVAATTWPLLQFSHSNADGDTGLPVVTLDVTNTGVGPALVRSARLTFDGRPVTDREELIEACCDADYDRVGATMRADRASGMSTSYLRERAVRPGETVTMVRMARTEANAAVWDALERSRGKLGLELCYCSVFEECWRGDAQGLGAKPVDSCRVEEAGEWS